MSLIEQAAKRLEQLRRSGAALPEGQPGETEPDGHAHEPLHIARVPTPEALVRELDAQRAETTSQAALLHAQNDTALAERRRGAASEGRDAQVKVEIDLARLDGLGFITPDAPHSQIAHEFRVLKRPILRNAQGRSGARVRNGNLVMVTSARPGEGKTFTAANLAISMAMEFGNTVLLVDGDVAHPSLPGVLGLPSTSNGLLDLLIRDDLGLNDVMRATNVEGLSVLTAGSRHPRATELLASTKMANFLRELAIKYADGIVIFDSPPLLATTEARVLATQMGQVVMVVAADATPKHVVTQALATIESCEVVLMMLNKSTSTDDAPYYGYYADDATR